MKIPEYILKNINQIGKYGFRLSRLEKQLYSWLELYGINTEELDTELEILIHNHNGEFLIKELERRLENENQVNVRTKKRNEREKRSKEEHNTTN